MNKQLKTLQCNENKLLQHRQKLEALLNGEKIESICHHQKMGYQTVKGPDISVSVKTKKYEVLITSLYCPPKKNY